MKKIALIGNMNNNFFAITRYIRDMGYDAHLFYRVGAEHFQPYADTYEQDYETFCHEVKWLDNGFHNIDKEEVKNALKDFCFFIGQGDEAAVAYKSGFNMDVYYPYGSDVYKYAYLPKEYSLLNKAKALAGLNRDISYKQMLAGTAAKYMNEVIVNARYVWAIHTNEEFEEKLKGLNIQGQYQHIAMPFIYDKEYERLLDTNSFIDEYPAIKAIKEQFDFIVLYHGRQEWKTYVNDFTNKNTHHLIIGFASFLNNNPATKAVLMMLEYGTDTEFSKQLIEELGIAENVRWFPKMYRKDLMRLVSIADVCTGEFDKSYLMFGTLSEAMIVHKPILHYRQDELYAASYDNDIYPLLNAREPEQITAMLNYAVNNREEIRIMGKQANHWLKTCFIAKPLRHLKELIEEKCSH
jgi:hypothetical protein